MASIDNGLVVSEEGGTEDNPILTVHPHYDETLLNDAAAAAAKISPKPKKTKLRESNEIDCKQILNVDSSIPNTLT